MGNHGCYQRILTGKLVAALNATSNSITDVQVALAEVYEMVLGGN